MSRTVILHVGAMKTGTSFVQAVMERNRRTLAAQGVLWPGRTWGAQVHAVQDVKRRRTASQAARPDAWDALVEQVHAWPGHTALISMEALAGSTAETVHAVVDSLAPDTVRVVLTVRDLARTVPAQWQESVQNGYTWSYGEYLAGVSARRPTATEAGTHFWRRQSWPRIVQRWGDAVGATNVVVVTVPPPGSPRTLLWERFCEATGLDSSVYDLDVRANESIGPSAAELMRRLNVRKPSDGDHGLDVALKQVLAKRVLVTHRSSEPALVLPRSLRTWAVEESRRLVTRIAKRSPTVVGDLAELVPDFTVERAGCTDDPSSLSGADLLDTAVHGLLGLAQSYAARQRTEA